MNEAHPAELAAIESRGRSTTERTAESRAALANNSETTGEAPPKTVAAMQPRCPTETPAADSASTKKLVKKPHFMQRYGSRGEFFEFDTEAPIGITRTERDPAITQAEPGAIFIETIAHAGSSDRTRSKIWRLLVG